MVKWNKKQPQQQQPPKKADVILDIQTRILNELDDLKSQVAEVKACQANSVVEKMEYAVCQNQSIYEDLVAQNQSLVNEIRMLSTQMQSVYDNLSTAITDQSEALGQKEEAYKQEVQMLSAQTLSVYEGLSRSISEGEGVTTTTVDDDSVSALHEKLATVQEMLAQILDAQKADQVQAIVAEDDTTETIAEATEEAPVEVVTEEAPVEEAVEEPVVEECVTEAKENTFLRAQLEQIQDTLAQLMVLNTTPATATKLMATDAVVEEVIVPKATQPVVMDIDYDKLAQLVADRITIPTPVTEEVATTKTEAVAENTEEVIETENIQEVLARMLENTKAEIMGKLGELDDGLVNVKNQCVSSEATPATVTFDEEALATKLAEKLVLPQAPEFDAESLVDSIVAKMPISETISADYLASKVVDQIVGNTPASATPVIDYEVLAQQVSELIQIPEAQINIDYQEVARLVAEKLPQTEVDPAQVAQIVADKLLAVIPAQQENAVVSAPQAPVFDVEELADEIAKKVGSIYSNEYEIVVDDDGCDSIATAVAEKIDATINDRIAQSIQALQVESPEIDTDELASKISEKVSVMATINEDALAEKAAAVLTNYLPEWDTDSLAESVVSSVIPAIPSAPAVEIDYNLICERITEALTQIQEEKDYDIVIDEAGIAQLADVVVAEIKNEVQTANQTLQEQAQQHFESLQEQADKNYTALRDQAKQNQSLLQGQADKHFATLQSQANAHYEEWKQATDEYFATLQAQNTQNMADLLTQVEDVKNMLAKTATAEQLESAKRDLLGKLMIVEQFTAIAQTMDSDKQEILTKIAQFTAQPAEQVQVEMPDYTAQFEALEQQLLAVKDSLITDVACVSHIEAIQHAFNEKFDSYASQVEALQSAIADKFDDVTTTVVSTKQEAQSGISAEEWANFQTNFNDLLTRSLSDLVDQAKSEILDELTGVSAELANLASQCNEDADTAIFEQLQQQLSDIQASVSADVLASLFAQSGKDEYDIELDEEGAKTLVAYLKEELGQEENTRLIQVEEQLEAIKQLLKSGRVVSEETAVIDSTALDEVDSVLITVSDITEQTGEQPIEEVEDGSLEELVEDIDEMPAEGEVMPDGMDEVPGGVDFANMMKYNRSFISRIIQETDDVKQYYGETKSALLSYKKVNSNVAWGAERFHKGRETIARFKIRGKTLCLYLALDPNEYEKSVYHQVDVSDNKSMHGTPMMVKIKSPRGVKKAIRLIDEMMAKRDGVKQDVKPRDYAQMYPYETIDELIDDGLVKDLTKK